MNTPGQMVTDEWLYLSTDPTRLTDASVAILTRGANDPEIIVDSIVMNESTGNATTVTARKVATGGVDDATSNFLHVLPLAASETLQLPDAGHPRDYLYLAPGDSIKMLASVTARVNVIINYRKRR